MLQLPPPPATPHRPSSALSFIFLLPYHALLSHVQVSLFCLVQLLFIVCLPHQNVKSMMAVTLFSFAFASTVPGTWGFSNLCRVNKLSSPAFSLTYLLSTYLCLGAHQCWRREKSLCRRNMGQASPTVP